MARRHLLLLALPVLAIAAGMGPSSGAPSATDWSGYLHDPAHSSFNAGDTAITPANVGSLAQKWTWKGDAATMSGQPGPGLFSSPTVADGSIYVGANNGYFYQLNATTGALQHKRFIGFRPQLTCERRGFIATATVAPDPTTGLDTVYVAGPDSKLYALSATDLSVQWTAVIDNISSTVSDYFQWSSPTVANGKIYIGSASHCDKPLTRGEVISFDQATGTELARFYTVPPGILGGGVWSSVAVDSDGAVYASTGTQPKNTSVRYSSVSIIKLDGTTLQKLGSYTVPDSELGGDGDFGGSPTIFGSHVGACNKNGYYYALDRATMTLDWHVRIGVKSTSADPAQCSAAAIWDGTYLYMAGDPTTINGVNYRGSIRRIDPATGKFLWQTGLADSALGSPTLNGGGVLGVGTFDPLATTSNPNRVYLVNKDTGAVIRTLGTTTSTMYFAQPVFANGWLYTARIGGLLSAFHL
jgi:polyvinyl alcohol dehydrogenase (cytochrome)